MIKLNEHTYILYIILFYGLRLTKYNFMYRWKFLRNVKTLGIIILLILSIVYIT